MNDKVLIQVYDEDYLVWTLLVNISDEFEIESNLKAMSREYFSDETLEEKYGSYYNYINEWLQTIPNITIFDNVSVVRL